MRHAPLVIWLLAAWLAPAALAHALDFDAIWGSGSAFVDYALPLPIAGGFLHLLSFVPLFVLAFALSGTAAPQGLRALGPAVLVGAALTGVVLLLDPAELRLAASSDVRYEFSGAAARHNPLGLFLVSDAVFALLLASRRGLSGPRSAAAIATAVAVAIAMPLVAVWSWTDGDSRVQAPVAFASAVRSAQRGDAAVAVHARLGANDPALPAAVRAFARDYDPVASVDASDLAVYVFASLDAARRGDTQQAIHTLCLYEDGTPARWERGATDCFDHDSFDDRLARAHATLDAAPETQTVPLRVRTWLAVTRTCGPALRDPALHAPGLATRMCAQDFESERQQLLAAYGADARVRELLAAN